MSRRSRAQGRNRGYSEAGSRENLPLYMNIWSTPQRHELVCGVLLFWTGGEKHGHGSAQAQWAQSAHRRV